MAALTVRGVEVPVSDNVSYQLWNGVSAVSFQSGNPLRFEFPFVLAHSEDEAGLIISLLMNWYLRSAGEENWFSSP